MNSYLEVYLNAFTGGLVWTDKIEQLEIAQTRVIDMNAEPVQKDSKPKY